MTEVRKHQRQTASGKRTTVRHHTRGGEAGRRREAEAEAQREAEADRTAPHVSALAPAEPEPQPEEWWAEDGLPPPGAFWDEDDAGEDGEHLHLDWATVEHEGHTFKVNRAPAYRSQGDHDFADDDDDERYRQRAAYLESHPDAAGLLADEQADRSAADVDDAAQRMIAERSDDEPQWESPRARHKAAKEALRANQEYEIEHGIDYETERFHKLNHEYWESRKDLPWWRRG